MGRAAPVAVAVVLACVACAKPRPRGALFDAIPAFCTGNVNVEECAGWVVDHVLSLSQASYVDERVTRYVASVGNRLVRAHGDRQPWRFVVSEDGDAQASAGLSRTVFINRGIIALLRDEAELAAVLGHEMAHVLGGHLHENYSVILRGEVERTKASDHHETRFARDDEIQADEVAVLLLARAGYDPRAVERMLRALAVTTPHDGEDPTDHHPRWIERIARVQAAAAALPVGEAGAQRFLERVSELVVGDDPRIAALVGGVAVFVHSQIAIDLPPHREASIHGLDVIVELDGTSGFGLRVLDPRMARVLAERLAKKPDPAFVIIERPRLSLAIAAVGDDAALIAKRLRDSIRVPRPDEVRALRPTRIDLSAPRALWQPSAATASRRSGS